MRSTRMNKCLPGFSQELTNETTEPLSMFFTSAWRLLGSLLKDGHFLFGDRPIRWRRFRHARWRRNWNKCVAVCRLRRLRHGTSGCRGGGFLCDLGRTLAGGSILGRSNPRRFAEFSEVRLQKFFKPREIGHSVSIAAEPEMHLSVVT